MAATYCKHFVAVAEEKRVSPNFIMKNSSCPSWLLTSLCVWWVQRLDYVSVASFVTVSSSVSLVLLLKHRGKRCLLKINELQRAQCIFSRTQSCKCLLQSVRAFAWTSNSFFWYINEIVIQSRETLQNAHDIANHVLFKLPDDIVVTLERWQQPVV